MAEAIISETVVSLNVDPNAPIGPVLKIVNGRPVVSSRQVADHFGKQHNNVIRSIEAIIRNAPESFNALNFERVEYADSKGEKRPAYDMTRDGFVVVAMGFTGKKAIAWKIAYVQAFNAMEAELTGKGAKSTGTITPSQQQEVKELVQAKASAFPTAVKGRVIAQIWARVQRKFKVPRYAELPVAAFGEARDYIITMKIQGLEAIPVDTSDAPKALPEPEPGTIQSYAWFYPNLPEGPEMWRRLSFRAADAFERLGKELDAIKEEAFRPFRENRRSGVATFIDGVMGPHHAMFAIADEHMRTAYRCIYETMDGLVGVWSLLKRG